MHYNVTRLFVRVEEALMQFVIVDCLFGVDAHGWGLHAQVPAHLGALSDVSPHSVQLPDLNEY